MNRVRPFTRAFVALLLLPLAFWLSTTRRISNPPSNRHTRVEEAARPSKISVVFAFLGAGLFSAVLAVALVLLWTEYDRGTPALTASPDEGELYLFFDRPGVAATIQVAAASDYWTDAMGDYSDDLLASVTIRDLPPGQSVGYAVSLSGTALPSMTYPAGERQVLDDRNCPQSVSEAVEACDVLQGDPEGWPVDEGNEEEFALLVGTMQNEDQSKVGASASFWVVSEGPTAIETAELREFQLPRVGRAWLPDQLLLTQTFGFGTRTPLFVPASLAIAVTYEDLSPTESLDAVEPAPVSRQPLAWVEGQIPSIAPSGTISDTRVKREAERGVFVIGVLAGVVVGLVPTAVIAWWRAVARAAKRAR